MKKIILSLLLICLFVTGCNSNSTKEGLNSKYNDLNNKVNENIEDMDNLIPNMQIIDDNMLETEYGLNFNIVENYISGISNTEQYKLYIAIKPKKGKDETVKKAMKIYFENLEFRLSNETNGNNNDLQGTAVTNLQLEESESLKMVKGRLEEEINGYYVYIVSSSNQEILSVLKKMLV